MKAREEVEVQLHVSTLALDRDERSTSLPGRFTPRERAIDIIGEASKKFWILLQREEIPASTGNRTSP
jgi:hypothetical protein